MIGITTFCMFDSSGKQGVIGVFFLRVAAAFVLGRSGCYLCTISNGMPISFALLLHENVRHCPPPSLKIAGSDIVHLGKEIYKRR